MSHRAYDVAIFVDGMSLPPKEGITVHIHELAADLSTGYGLNCLVVAADRGRATPEDCRRQPYDCLLLPSGAYYDRAAVADVIAGITPGAVINYNPYYCATVLGPVTLEAEIPLVVEHHDEQGALGFLNADDAETAFNVGAQHRANEFASLIRVMSRHDHAAIRASEPESVARKLVWLPVALGPAAASGHAARDRRTALFVGNCGYPPNAEAARIIAEEVAPLAPEWNFVLAGRGTDELRRQPPNVLGLGEVGELEPLLATATVGISPLTAGSGMKIKILTYLRAGLPVFATPISLQGYPESPAFRVCPDSTALVRTLRGVDPATAERMSAEAGRLFATSFSTEVVNRALVELLRTLRPDPEPSLRGIVHPAIDLDRLHWLREDQNCRTNTPAQQLFTAKTGEK